MSKDYVVHGSRKKEIRVLKCFAKKKKKKSEVKSIPGPRLIQTTLFRHNNRCDYEIKL